MVQNNQNPFLSKPFKCTHGYGTVHTKVNELKSEGLPNLLIRNIPPVTEYVTLEIDQPEIYYGELTESHVIVNSEEVEFDYSSSKKIFIPVIGNGGLQISN